MNKTPEQALCHLFFNCCGKDGHFDEKEIEWIASKFVELGVNRGLDFKNEFLVYTGERQHRQSGEKDYLKELIATIKPVNTLALFSWCVEICLCDDLISMDEQSLLENIASCLDIDNARKDAIISVMVERKVIQLNQIV